MSIYIYIVYILYIYIFVPYLQQKRIRKFLGTWDEDADAVFGVKRTRMQRCSKNCDKRDLKVQRNLE